MSARVYGLGSPTLRVAAVAAALVVCCMRVAASPALVIADVDVIDVRRGADIGPRDVALADGRIAAVTRPGAAATAPGVLRIDGHGKYLVPGLVDMHVHLFNNSSHRPPNDWAFPLFVANGVTGVREMNALPEQIAQVARWRAAVDAGELVAPRVLAAGVAVWPKTDNEARTQVREAKAAGADFIKVFSELPEAPWRAVLVAARKQDIPVDGHVPGGVALLDAARAGQRTAEHLLQAYEACSTLEADLLRQRVALAGDALVELRDRQEREVLQHFDRATCVGVARRVAATRQASVPTLVLSRFELERAGDAAADPRWALLRADEQARWRRVLAETPADDADLARRRADVSCAIVRAEHAAGVALLAGTDTPMPLVYPGYSLHDELELLAGCGLSNVEVLRAATIAPVQMLRLADAYGSIEPGKRADLVLLDADPLVDFRNLRRIDSVVLAGRRLPHDELDRLLRRSVDDAERRTEQGR